MNSDQRGCGLGRRAVQTRANVAVGLVTIGACVCILAVPMGWVDSWEDLLIPVVLIVMGAAAIWVLWEVAKVVITWWRGRLRVREIQQAYENLKKDDAREVVSGQQSLAEVLSSADARLWGNVQGNFSPDRPTVILLFDDDWPLSLPPGTIEYDERTATKATFVQPPQSLNVDGTSSKMLLALRTDAVIVGVNAAWLHKKSKDVLIEILQWHRESRHYRNDVSVIILASQRHMIPNGDEPGEGPAKIALERLQQSLQALQGSFNVARIRIVGFVDSQSKDGLSELLSESIVGDWVLVPGQEFPALTSREQNGPSALALDSWLAERRTLALAGLASVQTPGADSNPFPAEQLRQAMAKVLAMNGLLRKWVRALCWLYTRITFGNARLLADNRPIIVPHDQYLTHVWRFVEQSGIAHEGKSADRPIPLERLKSWWGDLGRVRYAQVSFASLMLVAVLALLLFYDVGSFRARRDEAVDEANDALKKRDEVTALNKKLAAQKTNLEREKSSMTAQAKELDAKLRQALRIGYWDSVILGGPYPRIQESPSPCSVAVYKNHRGKWCALVGAKDGLLVVERDNEKCTVAMLCDSNNQSITGDWAGLPIVKYKSSGDLEARELDFFACKRTDNGWHLHSVRLARDGTANAKQVLTQNYTPFLVPSGANLVNLLNDTMQQHAFVLVTTSTTDNSKTVLQVYGDCNHADPSPRIYQWQAGLSNVTPLPNTGVAVASRFANKRRVVFVCLADSKLVTKCIEIEAAGIGTVINSDNECDHKSWEMPPLALGTASSVKHNVVSDVSSGDVVMYVTFTADNVPLRRMYRFNWKNGWNETVHWDPFVSEQAAMSKAKRDESKWFFDQLHYPYIDAPSLLYSIENGGVIAIGNDASNPCRRLILIPPEKSVKWDWEAAK